jgi:tetratricopeptide (TPR) repeat protein
MAGDRLDSWKEIAAHLNRDVSTVQRWEKHEGMPIHRHLHNKLGSVYAFRTELDTWWQNRLSQATDSNPTWRASTVAVHESEPSVRASQARVKWTTALVVLVVAVGAGTWLAWTPNREGVRSGLTAGRGLRSDSLDAATYQVYLNARRLNDRRGPAGGRIAAGLFQQVIAAAPEFAPAYAGLAHAYTHMAVGYDGISLDEAQTLARPATVRALELDPLLAEAHSAMGTVHAYDRNWDESERSYRHAINLDPGLIQAYTHYANTTLRPLGRGTEAERLLAAARSVDPTSLDIEREIAQIELDSGRYEDALTRIQKILAIDPDFPFVRDAFLPRALVWSGRVEEAIRQFEGQGPGTHPYLSHAYVMAGRRADAEKLAAASKGFPFREVMIYSALGDLDRAFAALDELASREPHRVGLLLVYPETAALRGDPRLTAFRRRFGLSRQ